MFSELHSHTEMSDMRLPDCTNKIDKLIKHAEKMGLSAVAVTDHECLSGHIKAIQQAKKINEVNPDFKVILGNEIYLINEDDYQSTDKFWHFILLAKDAIGYKQLRQLSSRAWERSYYHKRLERVPTFYNDLTEVIGEDKGHLIASTACLGGFVPALVLNNKLDVLDSFLNWCVDLFGKDNFYLEIQPGISEEQIEFNKKAVSIAKQYDLGWIITNDVHYLTKDKRKIHAAYLNSKNEEREVDDFYESTYFKTEKEMEERLSYLSKEDIQKGLDNTIKITSMVEFYDLKHEVIVPERRIGSFNINHIFKKWYGDYDFIKNFANSKHEQDKYLFYMIEQGFFDKKEEFNSENLSRIDIELKQLWLISEKLNQRLSSYYNLVQENIEIIWDGNLGNSLVGIARGSVTGFYICYLIGITQINPIKWKLPYWRHLSSERTELPDVDIDSQASQRPKIFDSLKKHYGYENVLNIITFKTETSKAATLTACRGLGIDNDIAQEIADLVPMERGKLWSISDCLYGNEEQQRKPIKEFISKIEMYPLLKETVLEIENLICGRSSHASGVYIFKNGYIEQNALMKSPKGTYVTCWNMEDSDYCGGLKIDFLTIEALDKIRKTLDLLIADKQIKWQGTLKKTYDKYLHPDVLDYKSKEMWSMLGNNKIVDVFQMDTLVGSECVKKVKPTDLKQMALANSVMRLMADGDISPLDKFVSFKNDINLWYKEMQDNGLNEKEIKVLEKYLKRNFGLSVEQEDVMELTMDKEIANFDLVKSNKLRKGISKKKKAIIEEAKKMFFEEGLKNNTRQVMLDYVWNHCIKLQLGYSFSRNHTLPYSGIGLQEMNLAYKFPIIYWNTACLTVNASANEEIEDNKSTDYGKIAKAIGDMQNNGVSVSLPDINTSDFGFKPDTTKDRIIFGLKGINGIGDDIVYQIIQNRPYISLEDYLSKNEVGNTVAINLIKSGCFDELENKDRIEIMKDFITLTTIKNNEKKTTLNLQNFSKVLELEILPESMEIYQRIYNFRRYIFSKQFAIDKNLYQLDNIAQNFFEQHYLSLLEENKDFWYKENGLVVSKKSFEKVYKKQFESIKNWLQLKETVDTFNEKIYRDYATEIWDKYCQGTISKWEMDSVSFYYHEHELKLVNKKNYIVDNFFGMPSEPVVIDTYTKKGVDYPKYQLFKIVGTVLNRNKTKHYVSLLTPDGVVTVKFYSGAFVHYDKQISVVNSEGKKEVVEKSWFARGSKLLVTGMRRNDQFVAKRYFDSLFQHTVCLIRNINDNGSLDLQTEREKV